MQGKRRELQTCLFGLCRAVAKGACIRLFLLLKTTKGSEKMAESEEDLLKHRTYGTDTFDTVYFGCEKFPQGEVSNLSLDVNGIVFIP